MLLQREKMASLGTMAAGLMHELNNPGSAAKRASTQLRESLTRLQEMNLRTMPMGLQPKELGCISDLQHYVLQPRKSVSTNSLDQADAEESLYDWLDKAGVQDSWKLAPPLAGMGLTAEKLECLRASVSCRALSETSSGWKRW